MSTISPAFRAPLLPIGALPNYDGSMQTRGLQGHVVVSNERDRDELDAFASFFSWTGRWSRWPRRCSGERNGKRK